MLIIFLLLLFWLNMTDSQESHKENQNHEQDQNYIFLYCHFGQEYIYHFHIIQNIFQMFSRFCNTILIFLFLKPLFSFIPLRVKPPPVVIRRASSAAVMRLKSALILLACLLPLRALPFR